MKLSPSKIKKFQDIVWDYYHAHRRHNLPWRKNTDGYHVLVSEIMLQQTQVERVIGFYHAWMKMFPNWKRLATANQIDVLRAWKGLGYNSRAIRLHALAKIVSNELSGRLPNTRQELENLPGIGPYTAGAIMAFVYDAPTVMIETNIRRIFIHHFFPGINHVHDRDLLDVIAATLPKKDIRTWYWALMDYGAYLGRELKINGKKFNPNVQSRHYTKQSTFEGSNRQVRSGILSALLEKPRIKIEELVVMVTPNDPEWGEGVIDRLEREGFIEIIKGIVTLKK